MKILIMRLELRAEWVNSLKEKRMIVLSLTKRISNKFNVSVSEVDLQDVHERIGIGITAVSTTKEILYSLKEILTKYPK